MPQLLNQGVVDSKVEEAMPKQKGRGNSTMGQVGLAL